MRILTVDDSAIIRKIIRSAGESLDFEVEEAGDGREALKKLESDPSPVDLILLDWNMPGMSGLELLKILKSRDGIKKIPVMMVTTESERLNIITAVQAGAVNYLIKPFTFEELLKRIVECVGGR